MARGSIVRRAVEFGKNRQQFRKSSSTFQAIQHTLIEITVIEHGMQLFCDGTLCLPHCSQTLPSVLAGRRGVF